MKRILYANSFSTMNPNHRRRGTDTSRANKYPKMFTSLYILSFIRLEMSDVTH